MSLPSGLSSAASWAKNSRLHSWGQRRGEKASSHTRSQPPCRAAGKRLTAWRPSPQSSRSLWPKASRRLKVASDHWLRKAADAKARARGWRSCSRPHHCNGKPRPAAACSKAAVLVPVPTATSTTTSSWPGRQRSSWLGRTNFCWASLRAPAALWNPSPKAPLQRLKLPSAPLRGVSSAEPAAGSKGGVNGAAGPGPARTRDRTRPPPRDGPGGWAPLPPTRPPPGSWPPGDRFRCRCRPPAGGWGR